MRTIQASISLVATLIWVGCDDSSQDWTVDITSTSTPYRGAQNGGYYFQTPPPPWANETLTNPACGPPGEIFDKVYREKKNGYNPPYYRDSCNFPKFKIGKESYSMVSVDTRGSDTRLFFTRDNWYVLKIQDDHSPSAREMFWREHAAMLQARHTGVISVIEPNADLSLMSRECQSRSYVMRKVAGHDLSTQVGVSQNLIMEIGRGALKILEKFHDTGLIHGDIHLMNIMLGSSLDVENSIKLIDFGRSMSYIHPSTGLHRNESELKPFTSIFTLNWNILSINELEGKAVSRADDIFRLAEVLITLCTRELKNFGRSSPRTVATQKRNRTFESRVPHRLQEFYRYAMNIGFQERPNYKFLD